MKQLLMTLMLLALPTASLLAQEGPYVPCVDCEDFIYAPYPEPGHWYNPDQSGTGFNLEFQNGIMAGFYYGYSSEGDPEWYLVTNPLVRSETPGVMWEVEVEPQRFTGGNCMGCQYQPPDDPEKLATFKIDFLQRAYARVTYPDGSIQYIVPIMYGDSGKAFFVEQTPYIFPTLSPNPYASFWTLVFKAYGEEAHEPWKWGSIFVMISKPLIYNGEGYEGALVYNVLQPTSPPEVSLPFGKIVCTLDETAGEPVCTLIAGGLDPVDKPEFRIPIGNFTDSRFFGETERGDTVEGFRIKYD